MIPGRLSAWREFTPVPSLSSVFVYMISPKDVMLGCLTPARVHPGCCTRSENFVPARDLAMACKRGMTTRSGVKSASRWAGPGSACVRFLIDTIFAGWVYACILSICDMWFQEVTPVRVFLCKHPHRERNRPRRRSKI